MNRNVTCVCVAMLLAGAAAVASAQAPDPALGKWKLNVEKSTYPVPPPQSMVLTVSPAVRGYAMAIEAVGADGRIQKWGFDTAFDGAETPVSGNPSFDSVVARSTGTGATMQYKKAGTVVTTTSSVQSADGKSMTVTAQVPIGGGRELTIISVYDRQ